ncbi:unnamed protein product [Ectocarpus sp. 8 AP-2014]
MFLVNLFHRSALSLSLQDSCRYSDVRVSPPDALQQNNRKACKLTNTTNRIQQAPGLFSKLPKIYSSTICVDFRVQLQAKIQGCIKPNGLPRSIRRRAHKPLTSSLLHVHTVLFSTNCLSSGL